MTVNIFARDTARAYGVPYHDVRIAVNRLVNIAGKERRWAEAYVRDVLAAQNDLAPAVDAVIRETQA